MVLKWVDVGHAVPANTERIDQFLDSGGLVDRVGIIDLDVLRPANRFVGDSKGGKDVLVKFVLADEESVHDLEKFAGPSALDDAVVVGRRECDGFGDAQIEQHFVGGPLKLGRVIERSGADDTTLAAHQPRNRMNGSDAAGVRQRHGVAREIFGGEFIGASARHHFFVGLEEVGETHLFRLFDSGDEQRAGSVGFGDVDSEPEVDVCRHHERRYAVRLVVKHVL